MYIKNTKIYIISLNIISLKKNMLKKECAKRTPNFTTAEINFLLEEVEKLKGVIECKKTDRTRTEEKLQAWKTIESAFNAKFGQVFRTHSVLKTKYENVKKTAKSRFAADKIEQYRTGGGPLPAATATDIDVKISQICQKQQMFGNDAVYDDDVFEICDEEYLDDDNKNYKTDDNCPSISSKPTIIKAVALDEDDNKTKTREGDNCSWTKYTPKFLKAPVHRALNNKKEKTKDVWAKVGEAKLVKLDMEMEILKKQMILAELSETKLSLEIEKVKLEMEILQKRLKDI